MKHFASSTAGRSDSTRDAVIHAPILLKGPAYLAAFLEKWHKEHNGE